MLENLLFLRSNNQLICSLEIMANIKDVVAYCNMEGRNKIVFSESHIDTLQYINVGREIASLLIQEEWEARSDKEMLYEQVFNSFYYHDLIGRYLAIENIGMLFEEELHLCLHNIFDQNSIDQVLIVQAKGEVRNGAFCFYGSEQFSINLKGLSHIII